jgi:hypothetical protein
MAPATAHDLGRARSVNRAVALCEGPATMIGGGRDGARDRVERTMTGLVRAGAGVATLGHDEYPVR